MEMGVVTAPETGAIKQFRFAIKTTGCNTYWAALTATREGLVGQPRLDMK